MLKRDLFQSLQYQAGLKNVTKSKKTSKVCDAVKMIETWNAIARDNPDLCTRCVISKNPTKIYNETLLACRSFLNCSLFRRKAFVSPKGRFTKRAYTFEEFERGLVWYVSNTHTSKGIFMNRKKINLLTFLCGNAYSRLPSVFFKYCCKETAMDMLENSNRDKLNSFAQKWQKTIDKQISQSDIVNFEEYLLWAESYFRKQYTGFSSLRNFASYHELLEEMTFGTLRQYQRKSKYISSKILLQDFFQEMLENFRIQQGYTV